MMKRVCLIGDSIRQGYEPTVRRELASVADIFAPAENGQHTVNLLLNFYNWIQQKDPDVVHIAAGGWDVRNVVRGEPGNVVPLDHYRQNVARTIWATITPMDMAANFANHAATGHPARTAGDIEQYNAAAVAVCREQGVAVNDLYDVVDGHGPRTLLSPDGVHLDDAGYELLGKLVARKIRETLSSL
jgi:lysophospholipase L1-like esterase